MSTRGTDNGDDFGTGNETGNGTGNRPDRRPAPSRRAPGSGNSRVLVACVVLVGLMVGASYAAVPLYNLFCRVTGYGGTTQQAEAGADEIGTWTMRIRFDSNVAKGLPWEFRPVEHEMSLKTGETGLAFYRATNTSDRTIVGTATYNVTPAKAGIYFNKIQCFCFTEQSLAPGQSIDMPVQFFVDPEIEKDSNAQEVRTITLSYTFFEHPEEDAGETTRVSAVLK